MASNSNRGVVYLKPGHVEVQSIDFPTFRNPAGKTIDHGVILKVVTTLRMTPWVIGFPAGLWKVGKSMFWTSTLPGLR